MEAKVNEYWVVLCPATRAPDGYFIAEIPLPMGRTGVPVSAASLADLESQVWQMAAEHGGTCATYIRHIRSFNRSVRRPRGFDALCRKLEVIHVINGPTEDDLTAYIDTDRRFMLPRYNIQVKLARAWVGGYFDAAGAAMLYRPLIDRAAAAYLREFPPGADFDDPEFTPEVRQAVAASYAAGFAASVNAGLFDDLCESAAAIIRREG